MNLVPQLLGEVLACINAARREGRGSENRRTSRINVEAKVEFWLIKDGARALQRTVLTRDLSLSGIGFLHGTPLVAGQKFIVRLPREKRSPVDVLCAATHSRLLADDLYAIGACFLEVHDQPAPGIETPTVELPLRARRK